MRVRIEEQQLLLDFAESNYGFPRITVWPQGTVEVARPHILKFYCVKDGQKDEMYPDVVIARFRTLNKILNSQDLNKTQKSKVKQKVKSKVINISHEYCK